jgi:hypothetical protein
MFNDTGFQYVPTKAQTSNLDSLALNCRLPVFAEQSSLLLTMPNSDS